MGRFRSDVETVVGKRQTELLKNDLTFFNQSDDRSRDKTNLPNQ